MHVHQIGRPLRIPGAENGIRPVNMDYEYYDMPQCIKG